MSSNITEDFHLSLAYTVLLTLSNCLSSIIGSIGNTLVLIIIVKSSTLNSVTDYLIMSLATADLLTTALMQPMFTYHINYYTETSSTPFDVVLDITGYVSNLASIASMLVVTFDRLVAIRFPLKYKSILSKRRVFVFICVVWTCSVIFGVLFRLYSLPSGLMWGICSLLLLGTLSAYPYIFFVAHKQEKLTRKVTATAAQRAPREASKTTPSSEKTNRFRIFAEKKSTKTVAIVVGVFALCWVPILIYTLIKLKRNSNKQDFLPGFFAVYTASMCNSTFNPFIYCGRNQRYRSMFKKLVRRHRSVASRTTGIDNRISSRT